MKNDFRTAAFQVLLTALIGTPIGLLFQWKYHQYEVELSNYEEKRKSSLEFLMDVSAKMDKRIYDMSKCYKLLNTNVSENNIEKQWGAYRVTLDEWNGALNQNIILSGYYFGQDVGNDFENLHRSFRDLGQKLDADKREGKRGKSVTKLKKQFGDINAQMKKFFKNGLERSVQNKL